MAEPEIVTVEQDAYGGDGDLCEHGNLIDDEFCDECAAELWRFSDELDKREAEHG